MIEKEAVIIIRALKTDPYPGASFMHARRARGGTPLISAGYGFRSRSGGHAPTDLGYRVLCMSALDASFFTSFHSAIGREREDYRQYERQVIRSRSTLRNMKQFNLGLEYRYVRYECPALEF